MTAWTVTPDGVTIAVRLTPRSSKDALEGVERLSDGRDVVKARVRAVPEDGKANDALLKLLAKTLGAPRSAVDLAGGATSRLKTIRISGDGPALAKVLERLSPAPKG